MVFAFKKGGFSLLVLSAVSFLFICLGTGGNAWVRQELSTKHGSVVKQTGLWRVCSSSSDVCQQFTVTKSYLLSCRAMAVLSALSAVIALVLSAVGYCDDRVKPFMVSSASLFAAITMFISVVVYVSMNDWIEQPNMDYGWTFTVAWISIAFSLITASVALVIARFGIE